MAIQFAVQNYDRQSLNFGMTLSNNSRKFRAVDGKVQDLRLFKNQATVKETHGYPNTAYCLREVHIERRQGKLPYLLVWLFRLC